MCVTIALLAVAEAFAPGALRSVPIQCHVVSFRRPTQPPCSITLDGGSLTAVQDFMSGTLITQTAAGGYSITAQGYSAIAAYALPPL